MCQMSGLFQSQYLLLISYFFTFPFLCFHHIVCVHNVIGKSSIANFITFCGNMWVDEFDFFVGFKMVLSSFGGMNDNYIISSLNCCVYILTMREHIWMSHYNA